MGRSKTDAEEGGGGVAQGLGGINQACGDCSSQKTSLGGDDIEGGSGAKGDDNGRPAVQGRLGERCWNPVGANLPGIVHPALYSKVQGMIQHDRLFATVTQRQFLKNRSQWWNHARQDDIVNISQLMTGVAGPVVHHPSTFVCGALGVGLYHPYGTHGSTVIKAT